MLVDGEDGCWHRLSTERCFGKRVGHLVEVPQDVIEFEAFEFVLQPSDLLAVRSHLGIMAARLLHDLVNDQLGVASNVEASDAQLDGDS